MDDLISREAAIKGLLSICPDKTEPGSFDEYGVTVLCGAVDVVIKGLPAVDAAPVVHGRWIDSETGLWQHCSVCGVAVEKESMFMCKASEDSNFNYCPNCGAEMDGDVDGTR